MYIRKPICYKMIEAKVYWSTYEMFQGPIEYKEQSILFFFFFFKSILNYFEHLKIFLIFYQSSLYTYASIFCRLPYNMLWNTKLLKAYTDGWAT